MIEWVIGNVVKIKYWTKDLFSLIIHAPVDSFIAGQFTKIKIENNNKKIYRAYSYVNPPKDKNLEFYLRFVTNGIASKYLHELKVGDNIFLSKKASGYFTINQVPPCDNLWMISTGTALGPYLSILKQGENLDKFKKIILVHAVSYSKELSYLSEMINLQKFYYKKLYIKTIVSKEHEQGSLHGRIPNLISNGKLESELNLYINNKNSHVMLCGNPNMISDTQKVLYSRNMIKHSRYKFGHITSEMYW